MNAPPTLVLVNPAAGSVDDAAHLRAHLDALHDRMEAPHCESPDQVEAIVREARARGVTRFVAAGGDGSLNQLVEALGPDLAGLEFGVLPLGTGNDFARSAGVPDDIDGALAVLSAGRVVPVDLLRVTSRAGTHFGVNASAAGFSVKVDEKVTSGRKEWLGKLAYVLGAGLALPDLEQYALALAIDGEAALETDVYSLVVANGRTVAGGIPVAPEASIADGLLDIVLFTVTTATATAALLPRIMNGSHVGDPAVVTRQARRVAIESTPPLPYNLDGEVIGETPVTYEVLPGALRFVVGPDFT